MAVSIFGALANVGVRSVPTLTGIFRHVFRSIPGSGFVGGVLQRLAFQFPQFGLVQIAKLFEFTAAGIESATSLTQGTADAFTAANRAPLAVLETGTGAGGRRFQYRIVYDLGFDVEFGDRTRSFDISSPTPIDLTSTLDLSQDHAERTSGKKKYPKLKPEELVTIEVIGIDFVVQVQS